MKNLHLITYHLINLVNHILTEQSSRCIFSGSGLVSFFRFDNLMHQQVRLGAHSNGGKHHARHTGVKVAYYKEGGNVLEAERANWGEVGWG